MPLTPNGLIVPRFPETLTSVEARERTNINPNINTNDDQFLGQLNQIMSEFLTSLYELTEAVNANFNIDSAEGKNLDDLGALKDVLRLDASNTQGAEDFTGDPFTSILQGTVLENGTTGDRYLLSEDVSLSTSSCIQVVLSVTVENSTAYTVTINSTNYSYTSDASALQSEILSNLNSLINAGLGVNYSSQVVGGTLIVTSDDGDDLNINEAITL